MKDLRILLPSEVVALKRFDTGNVQLRVNILYIDFILFENLDIVARLLIAFDPM